MIQRLVIDMIIAVPTIGNSVRNQRGQRRDDVSSGFTIQVTFGLPRGEERIMTRSDCDAAKRIERSNDVQFVHRVLATLS